MFTTNTFSPVAAFMGGITYRVPFENIGGKKTVTSVANHFNANTSVVVDVQIAEE